ncbi:MAG: hypothetical protein ACI38U_14205 [Corynebacterium sp.]|uniref:hypothetical protein n=1 Tax=Corynebacterium sp. TaxID=1720 RepID=UPI003F091B9B
MPDQTPVTDDDREAHLFADDVLRNPDSHSVWTNSAARAIKAHVPAPPASISDELRYRATLLYNGDPDGDSAAAISALADRVEAVEKENKRLIGEAEERQAWNRELTEQKATLARERDAARAEAERWKVQRDEAMDRHADDRIALAEARAEVEQMSRQVADQMTAIHTANAEVARLTREVGWWASHGTSGGAGTSKESLTVASDLPDPADVPESEPYLVKFEDGQWIGLRSDPVDVDEPWQLVNLNDTGIAWTSDAKITLVSRLVPDTRRVIDRAEDLDKLSAEAVVLSVNTRYALQHGDDGDGWYGTASTRKATSAEILARGPVTVIHEPMSDSGDCKTQDYPTRG